MIRGRTAGCTATSGSRGCNVCGSLWAWWLWFWGSRLVRIAVFVRWKRQVTKLTDNFVDLPKKVSVEVICVSVDECESNAIPIVDLLGAVGDMTWPF